MVASACALGFLAVAECCDCGLADRQSATRSQDAAARDQQLALRRREQIELELDGQHLAALRRQRQRGVARRAVRDRRDHAGVHVAVLLRQLGPRAARDSARALADLHELGPEVLHQPLAGEARAHPLLSTRCAGHGRSLGDPGTTPR
jgi:hypothetical protein